MSDPLALLLRLSLVFSLAVAVVAGLRIPLRRWAGPRAAYGLWLIVPLCCAAALAPPPPAAIALLPAPVIAAAGPDLPIPSQAKAIRVPISPSALVLGLWLAGSAGLALLFAARQAVYAAREPGPAVVGGLFPHIVLPDDFATRFTSDQQALILAHERAHLSGLHPQTNLLLCALQCVQWFNPLAHYAARLLHADQELVCDAAVMRAHPDGWRAYGEALLMIQPAGRAPLASCWSPRSSTLMKERFAMLSFTSPDYRSRLAACAVAVLVATGAAAAYAAQPAAQAGVYDVRISVQRPSDAAPPAPTVLNLNPGETRPLGDLKVSLKGRTAASPQAATLTVSVEGSQAFGKPQIDLAPDGKTAAMSLSGAEVPFKAIAVSVTPHAAAPTPGPVSIARPSLAPMAARSAAAVPLAARAATQPVPVAVARPVAVANPIAIARPQAAPAPFATAVPAASARPAAVAAPASPIATPVPIQARPAAPAPRPAPTEG